MLLGGLVMVLMCLCVGGDERTEALKTMTLTFGRKILECDKVYRIEEDVMTDLRHFWQRDYQLTKKAIGCALICVCVKLHLLDWNGDFLFQYAEAFIKASGADDEMADCIQDLIVDCHAASNATDPCSIALEVANCFRESIHQREYAPVMPAEIATSSSEIYDMVY